MDWVMKYVWRVNNWLKTHNALCMMRQIVDVLGPMANHKVLSQAYMSPIIRLAFAI